MAGKQESLDLMVGGQLVSNHTILAIVEGMRARGYFRKGPQGRKDGLGLATALKLVNEYMAYPDLGRYTVEATKHRPIQEIPRADYEPVEIMRACDNYLAQITEAFKANSDEEAIIYMVKDLRKQVIADGIESGALKVRKYFGKHGFYYMDDQGKWQSAKVIDWNIGEVNPIRPAEQAA